MSNTGNYEMAEILFENLGIVSLVTNWNPFESTANNFASQISRFFHNIHFCLNKKKMVFPGECDLCGIMIRMFMGMINGDGEFFIFAPFCEYIL